jgi:hypothetical protein
LVATATAQKPTDDQQRQEANINEDTSAMKNGIHERPSCLQTMSAPVQDWDFVIEKNSRGKA